MMNYRIDKAVKRRDERGFLVDFLKGDEVEEESQQLGQIYLVTFEKPHMIRGNHYHETKNEWFVVIQGKIRMVLEDRDTKEQYTLILDGDNDSYERIFVGKGTAHAFQNITPSAIMLDYADKPYHYDKPDTIKYNVIK